MQIFLRKRRIKSWILVLVLPKNLVFPPVFFLLSLSLFLIMTGDEGETRRV